MTFGSNGGGYDVIGDVHGHADALVDLLTTMGYRERDGVRGDTMSARRSSSVI